MESAARLNSLSKGGWQPGTGQHIHVGACVTTRQVPGWLHDMAMPGMVNANRPSRWVERDLRRSVRVARADGTGLRTPGSRQVPGAASERGRHRAEDI